MKNFLLLITTSFISLASIGQNAKDTDAVEKVIIAFQDDFNDGSFKNASNYATLDWEHIAPNGWVGKGRDTLVKGLKSVHQSILKGVSMTVENMSVRFITADVAIADVIHNVSNYTTPDGVKHENERHIKTYVVVKKEGKWLLAHDHNTVIEGSNTAANQK